MSLLTYGFTGSYTNITYPTPQCGFFDWTIDGSSLEFGDYQSRICISNKVVIALTVTNCIASTATWTFGIYLTVREFSMVREWNDTKNFCLFYFVGAVGAALFAVNDIVGSPVWNSVGWYLATIGVCAMEAFTVLLWARITLKILNLKKHVTDTTPKEMMRWLGRIMVGLTSFVCIGLLPVFVLRASWYSFKDPWWYNTLMWLYHVIMLPWFPMFATTVIVFGVKLTKLLRETMESFEYTTSNSNITFSGNGVLGTANYSQRSETRPLSAYAQIRVDSRRAKIQSAIRKIKIVAILVCLDKLGFLLSYLVFAIYGGTTMYEPERGMGAYFSYIAMNGLIIFWGNGLLIGCGWYHLRADRSPDELKSEKISGSTHSDGGQVTAFDYAASTNPIVANQKQTAQEMAFYQNQALLYSTQEVYQHHPNGYMTSVYSPNPVASPSRGQELNQFGLVSPWTSSPASPTRQIPHQPIDIQQLQQRNGQWIQQHLSLQQLQLQRPQRS